MLSRKLLEGWRFGEIDLADMRKHAQRVIHGRSKGGMICKECEECEVEREVLFCSMVRRMMMMMEVWRARMDTGFLC